MENKSVPIFAVPIFAWGLVSDLFIETHGRGRPRLSDRLMLDGVLWVLCSVAAWRGALRPVVNGVSKVSELAKSGHIRSDAQTSAPEIEWAGFDRSANLEDRRNRSTYNPSLIWRSEKRGLTSLRSRSRPQSRRSDNQDQHALRRQWDTVALPSLWQSSQ